VNSPTVQFVENARRGQEAVTTAVHTWSDAVQNYAGTLYTGPFPLPNAHAAVNAAFDLATQLLAQQREFANTLLDAGTRTGEAIASVGGAVAKAGTDAPATANEAGEKLTEQARGGTTPRATHTAQNSNETTKRTRTERTPSV
jgi:class 3 adenylate cyclase